MRVILLENIPGLGRAGDIKSVRGGFGRNYLIPQKFAEMATEGKEKYLERKKVSLAKKAKMMFESAQEMKKSLEEVNLVITKKSSVEGKIFGSVRSSDVVEILKDIGYSVQKKQIVIQHVKTIGDHTFYVRLDEGVTAEMKITVETIQ